jgi:hypothetical protein
LVTLMPMLATPLVRVYPVAGAGAAAIVAMSPRRTGSPAGAGARAAPPWAAPPCGPPVAVAPGTT